LSAAKAETVSITTDKNLTLSDGNTTLTGAKTVTIDTAGAFVQDDAGATDTEGFTAAQTLTLSGAGSKASATFDSLVGADDLAYSMSINASGLKGGLTFGNDVDAGSGSLTVDASAVTGDVDMSKMDAAGTVTFTASSLGANQLDVITAKNVVINGSEALGGISYITGNDIVAGSSVTIDGPTVSATDVDIIASATATSLTVDVDGGIVADNIDVTGTTTVKTITVKGDAGVGTDVYRVTLADYGTDTTSTVTVDMSGVVADTANQSDVQIDIQAESTNALSITGTKGNDDTVVFTNTYSTTKAITLSGVEKMLIDDATTLLATTLSGQTIDLTGTAGGEVVTLNGTAGADTIDLSNVTIDTGNDPVITIAAGDGADTITLGAVTETVGFSGVATAANGDTIADFTVGTDIIALDVDYTTVTTAAGGAEVIEDEATAAANANGAAYDLAAALTTATTGLDLVTLDTAVLANIANADLSEATDGTELLKALVTAGAGNTADAITVDAAGDDFYLAVDDGTDGYLYIVSETSGDTEAAASEITLVGTFTDAATFGDIVGANVVLIA